VRVEANPYQLNSYGISLETVRKSLQAANANLAKGALSDPKQAWAVSDTDQLFKAYEYQPLIVAGHVGAPVVAQAVGVLEREPEHGGQVDHLLLRRGRSCLLIYYTSSVQRDLPDHRVFGFSLKDANAWQLPERYVASNDSVGIRRLEKLVRVGDGPRLLGSEERALREVGVAAWSDLRTVSKLIP